MKETIFKNITEIKEYITVDISSDFNIIAPYILQAEKYVKNIIGEDLFQQLIDLVNKGASSVPSFQETNINNYTPGFVSGYENITGWDNYPTMLLGGYNKSSYYNFLITDENQNEIAYAHFEASVINAVPILELNSSGVAGILKFSSFPSVSMKWSVTYEQGGNQYLNELLPYCQLALANFGYLLGVAKLNVNVGATGITVTSNQNLTPANEWRVKDLKESLELSGNDALEQLISFLEKNKDNYPEWSSSSAYSFQKKLFINNATEFFKATMKQISRLELLALREFIVLSEVEIKEAICIPLFNELKSQFETENISPENEILLNYIYPAVAYLSYAKKNNDDFYKLEGDKKIKQLRNYLNTNAATYPLYESSDCYNNSTTDYNSDDSCVYSFGL